MQSARIASSSTSLPQSWKYIQPARRSYGTLDVLPSELETVIQRAQLNMQHIVDVAARRAATSPAPAALNKTISQLNKTREMVIVPSDKTKRLVALDATQYEGLFNEHLANYKELNRVTLPSTVQQGFNRRLQSIANELGPPVSVMLERLKCSEPMPSNMYILPKDHKEPLRGRPLVAAVDAPGTALSRWLADCLKPTLRVIPAHLASTHDFVSCITNLRIDCDSEQFLVLLM